MSRFAITSHAVERGLIAYLIRTMTAIDACAQPTDPIPALFAPRVVRVAKTGAYPWEVHCEIDPRYCSTRAKTKREAIERSSEPSWARFAAQVAEREGLTRAAPTPAEVCSAGPLDLYYPEEPAPWMRSGKGDYAYCGRPVSFLGDARTLATFRLAWPDERMREALDPDRRWARDWTTWVEASVQAKTDLAAGSLTPEEETALGATPETASWLRLDDFAQKCLREGVFSPTGHDLRAFYTPGSFAHDRTCWAT